MDKIQRVSLFFRILFQIIFILIPVTLVIKWVYAPQVIHLGGMGTLRTLSHSYPILGPLTLQTKILGFLASLIPMTVNLIVLYFLIQLFRLYEQGEIFSLKNVRYIRNIGYTLLVGQLVHPIYDVFISIVLTWNNHLYGGMRYAAITIDRTNIGVLLTALLVILISWIMAEGCKLREESQLTI